MDRKHFRGRLRVGARRECFVAFVAFAREILRLVFFSFLFFFFFFFFVGDIDRFVVKSNRRTIRRCVTGSCKILWSSWCPIFDLDWSNRGNIFVPLLLNLIPLISSFCVLSVFFLDSYLFNSGKYLEFEWVKYDLISQLEFIDSQISNLACCSSSPYCHLGNNKL